MCLYSVTVQKQLERLYPDLVNPTLKLSFYFPHRLDYATSGVLCIAKHKKACAAATKAFEQRQTKKYEMIFTVAVAVINSILLIPLQVWTLDVKQLLTFVPQVLSSHSSRFDLTRGSGDKRTDWRGYKGKISGCPYGGSVLSVLYKVH